MAVLLQLLFSVTIPNSDFFYRFFYSYTATNLKWVTEWEDGLFISGLWPKMVHRQNKKGNNLETSHSLHSHSDVM